MKKTVTFTDADEKLVKKITQFQKANGHKSFVAAVRELCGNALDLKRISK